MAAITVTGTGDAGSAPAAATTAAATRPLLGADAKKHELQKSLLDLGVGIVEDADPADDTPDGETPVERARRKRAEIQEQLDKAQRETAGLQERMLALRFDPSHSPEHIAACIAQMGKDLLILEEEIDRLRRLQLRKFEKAMALGEVGLSKTYFSKALAEVRARRVSRSRSGFVAGDGSVADAASAVPLPRANSSLGPRTGSGNAADHRWGSLVNVLRMVPAAHRAEDAVSASRYNAKAMEEEIQQLRTTLYTLHQKKTLTDGEEQLLRTVSLRLKQLTELRQS